MTTHAPPFTGLRALPADLAMGFYLCVYALAGIAWDEIRRWRIVRMP